MKAHRRFLTAAALAASLAFVAGPAQAGDVPDIDIDTTKKVQEIDCSADGLLNILAPVNVLSCFSFVAD